MPKPIRAPGVRQTCKADRVLRREVPGSEGILPSMTRAGRPRPQDCHQSDGYPRSPSRPEGLERPGACATLLRIASGAVSARQALEDCLETIKTLNPDINAVVAMDAEGARLRADALDRERAEGGKLRLLHGLPMTLKETFDLAGMPTTWGDPALADAVPLCQSTVAARLMAAGAVILGKTNVPERLADWETHNRLFGSTRNPWDLTRSAGGSSGGSAAAVASAMAGADIGSDLGGSIRIPAHYCGVYGLKPTWNIIPMAGHSLPRGLRHPDINAAGPITRQPEDLALLLSALTGPGELESDGWTLALPEPEDRPLSACRFACLLDHPDCPIDRPYLELMQSFVETLRAEGAQVDDGRLPDFSFSRANELMNLLVRGETSTRLTDERFDEALALVGNDRIVPDSHGYRNALGAVLPHRDWLLLHEERLQIRKAWRRFFRDYDAFLCPVAAGTAPPIMRDCNILDRTVEVNGVRIPMLDQHFWAAVASLPYLPSVSMPIGRTRDGLPAGIQVVGLAYHDFNIIDICVRIASRRPGA